MNKPMDTSARTRGIRIASTIIAMWWGNSTLHAGTCASVEQAVLAGMRQPRIFATAYAQLPGGDRGDAVLSAVTIGDSHYLVDAGRVFGPTPVGSPQIRQAGSGLLGFLPGENCRALGTEAVASREALKFAYVTDLGNGPTNVTLWIDRATNLPLRGITDEPEVDVDVGFSKDGDLETRKRPTGKRSRHISVFLFGDAVKAPVKKQLDPGMQAAIQELLR